MGLTVHHDLHRVLEASAPTGAHTQTCASVCQQAVYGEDAAAREVLHIAQVGVQATPLHLGDTLVTGQAAVEPEGCVFGHSHHRIRGIHMEGLA